MSRSRARVPGTRPLLVLVAAAALPLGGAVGVPPLAATPAAAALPARPAPPTTGTTGTTRTTGTTGTTGTVTVFPTPGSGYNSSRTEISLRGVSITKVGRVTVRGSSTGAHAGQLRAHSDGKGVSFVPKTPFRGGETVTVDTALAVRGGTNGDWRFRISRRAPFPATPIPVLPGQPTRASYRSAPDVTPPVYTTRTPATGAAPGLTFSAPYGQGGVAGTMISDDDDQVVYYRETPGSGFDFRVQQYQGQPVLTYWTGGGVTLPGTGQGQVVVLDTSYREIARFNALSGYAADIHEFTITPRGTALMSVYAPVLLDARSVGGVRDTRVLDSVFQEVDLASGRLLFEWHSLDHIGLTESYLPPPTETRSYWDYSHLNSVQLYGDGFLLSLRSTHSLVKVDRSGAVAWRLGGKRGNFRQGPGAAFHSQHDAVPHGDGTISLFDNAIGAGPSTATASRGLTLRLDLIRRTSTVVRSLSAPGDLLAQSQGNFEQLAGGGGLVGYGSASGFVEYAPAGAVAHDVRLGSGIFSYRIRKADWHATPTTRPAVAAQRSPDGVSVFASWNGATEVRSWRVLAGDTAEELTDVSTAARSGFETALRAPAGSAVVAVQALDAAGAILATSPSVPVR